MAIETQDIAVSSGEHVVKFYEHDRELVEAVVPYLMAAVEADEVAIVIATEAHRMAFQSALGGNGIEHRNAAGGGGFFWLDAADTMAAFMAGGKIDHAAFHRVIGGLVREAGGSGRSVRAYGEMVALLWDDGDVLGAIELETLWNDLARELPFALFCAYPAASVSGSEHEAALHQVCHLHSSVLDAPANSDQADVPSETEIVAEFPAGHDSPGHARRAAVAALRRWGCEDTLVEDTALVLSELASNAVLHAGSPFSIQVRAEKSMLRVAVRDQSPLSANMPAEKGGLVVDPMHGLGLIDALCTRWGVEGTSNGKVVWAQLPYQGAKIKLGGS